MRLEKFRKKVESLYLERHEGRADWADWIYPNHVVVVTKYARVLAERKGANVELSQVAALLHDIADFKMKRENPDHEIESLKIARELMKEFGYNDNDINLVVEDAIRYHSCHGKERPKSKEGLVLATADSLAHLQTDFYIYFTWDMGKTKSLEYVKDWVLKKIERDLNNKISFDDVREEIRLDFEMIKNLFSR